MKEIEQIFKRKLKHEGEAYLSLEQEGIEMEQAFDKQIQEIKDKNEEAIWKLYNEFKSNLLKVEVEFNESKYTAQSLEQYYSERLLKQEDEHQLELVEIERLHKKVKTEKDAASEALVKQ